MLIVNGRPIDPISRAPIIETVSEERIHAERAWQLIVPVGLPAGLTQTLLIQVGARECHLTGVNLFGDRDARYELYHGTVPDAPVGGAAFAYLTDIFNRTPESADAPATVFIDGPSLVGTWAIGNRMDFLSISVAAWSQSKQAEGTQGEKQWVLGPNADYAIQIINLDGGNPLVMDFKLNFFEHG